MPDRERVSDERLREWVAAVDEAHRGGPGGLVAFAELFTLSPAGEMAAELLDARDRIAHLETQIERLAAWFTDNAPEQIGEGGAVDNAIDLLDRYRVQIANLTMWSEADARDRIARAVEALPVHKFDFPTGEPSCLPKPFAEKCFVCQTRAILTGDEQ